VLARAIEEDEGVELPQPNQAAPGNCHDELDLQPVDAAIQTTSNPVDQRHNLLRILIVLVSSGKRAKVRSELRPGSSSLRTQLETLIQLRGSHSSPAMFVVNKLPPSHTIRKLCQEFLTATGGGY
jgi:hypothetical protein